MEKNPKTALIGRNPDGTFSKGNQIRRVSKGMGLRALILERTRDGEELVDAMLSLARGEPQIVPMEVRMPDGSRRELEAFDASGSPLPSVLIPSLSERAPARTWLCDHAFGKAPERFENEHKGEQLVDT